MKAARDKMFDYTNPQGLCRCVYVADEPVNVALLMPTTGSWLVGFQIAGAAPLAVKRVNADKTLLHGRTLTYSWEDSGCTAADGLRALGSLWNRLDGRMDAVIGSYKSHVGHMNVHTSNVCLQHHITLQSQTDRLTQAHTTAHTHA